MIVSTGYAPPSVVPTVSDAAAYARAAAIAASPSNYILRNRPRAVFDQGDVPCCVSCALAGAMQVLRPGPPLSPLYHYYGTSSVHGGGGTAGLTLGFALARLAACGMCLESLHHPPMTPDGASVRPTPEADQDAKQRRLAPIGLMPRYRRLFGDSLAATIRDQLRRDRPVVVGFTLPVDYPDSFAGPKKDEWLDPNHPAPSSSHHCALVVGYSDTDGRLLVQDSRGVARFDGGCWWMGHHVADSALVQEAYVLFWNP